MMAALDFVCKYLDSVRDGIVLQGYLFIDELLQVRDREYKRIV